MDDSELTKKAIEELVGEIAKNKMNKLPAERKQNPMGKPNKHFLGRTIKSIIRHNKQQSDRNHQKCQRKLKELDGKNGKKEYNQTYRNYRRKSIKHGLSVALNRSGSSDCSSRKGDHTNKIGKRLKKKKRRKKEQKIQTPLSENCCSETDTSSSTNSFKQNKNSYRKQEVCDNNAEEERNQNYFSLLDNDGSVCYYVNSNMPYAAMAHAQMSHMLHQQQMILQEIVNEEIEENVEVADNLSISCLSDSSLNISLNSSSVEEDENGILTFKLSSDDEKVNTESINTNENQKIIYITRYLMENGEDDGDSDKSHISVRSETSESNAMKECSKISLSSGTSSDSDDPNRIQSVADKVERETIKKIRKNCFMEGKTNNNGAIGNKVQNFDLEEKQPADTIVDLTNE